MVGSWTVPFHPKELRGTVITTEKSMIDSSGFGLGLDVKGREEVSGYGLRCSFGSPSFVGVLWSVVREADDGARLATVAKPALVTGHRLAFFLGCHGRADDTRGTVWRGKLARVVPW